MDETSLSDDGRKALTQLLRIARPRCLCLSSAEDSQENYTIRSCRASLRRDCLAFSTLSAAFSCQSSEQTELVIPTEAVSATLGTPPQLALLPVHIEHPLTHLHGLLEQVTLQGLPVADPLQFAGQIPIPLAQPPEPHHIRYLASWSS